MNTNSSPKAEDISRLSELLLYQVVLGDGVVSPFPETRGLVFSSAVPFGAHKNLRDAEREFLVWHDLQQKPERDELEALESGPPPPIPAMVEARKARIKELREKLSKIPAVTWRESDTHKSTMVELMKRSHYNAVSFVDEYGARIAKSSTSPTRMSSDLGWITLTEGTNDSAFIRSSASGGATIHSLAGDACPKFSYFSSVSESMADKLIRKVLSTSYASAATGNSIVIPGRSTAQASFSKAQLVRVLMQVFAKGGTENRLEVIFESEKLKGDWEEFIDWDLSKYDPHPMSEASAKAYARMPATTRTIALFASRAALVGAVLERVGASPSRHSTVTLTEADLDYAKKSAGIMFRLSSGVIQLEARRSQADGAREAFRSPERIVNAEAIILEAINSSPDGKVARSTLIRTPGVTAGLLDILVARDHLITELKGVDVIKMGKTSRAYILKKDSLMSAEEAVLELESAKAELKAFPEGANGSRARREFITLRAEAEKNRVATMWPVVPISHMTSDQIRMVPIIMELFPDDVCLRNTPENPEPPHLLEPAEEGEACLLEEGVPNLWFRHKPDGTDARDWHIATGLGFAKQWGDPNQHE